MQSVRSSFFRQSTFHNLVRSLHVGFQGLTGRIKAAGQMLVLWFLPIDLRYPSW